MLRRAGQLLLCWPSGARDRLARCQCHERRGGQVAETRMRALAIVLFTPGFYLAPRVVERDEDLLVETLLAQPALERFHEGVLNRLARLDELQPHAGSICPFIHHPAAELGAVVGLDHRRRRARLAQPLQHPGYRHAGKRCVHLDRQAFPDSLIDHHQRPQAAPAQQRVMNEIDRPRVVNRLRPFPHHPQVAQPTCACAGGAAAALLRGTAVRCACDLR